MGTWVGVRWFLRERTTDHPPQVRGLRQWGLRSGVVAVKVGVAVAVGGCCVSIVAEAGTPVAVTAVVVAVAALVVVAVVVAVVTVAGDFRAGFGGSGTGLGSGPASW